MKKLEWECVTYDKKGKPELCSDKIKNVQDSKCNCLSCEALRHYIEKCDIEINQINHGVSTAHALQDLDPDLPQLRLEHICHLKETLKFILEKPTVEINI